MREAITVPMLLVLALLSATSPVATGVYLPGLPSIASALGTSNIGVQLTLTTFMVGLGLGQLLAGALSDSWGRRRLLLGGSVAFTVASAVCALAPTIGVLTVARLIAGFSGGIGVVLARAVISDRARGIEAARLFSVMMIIGGVAPVIAPVLGGMLLGPIGWRGTFWVLTAIGGIMTFGVATAIPETLPPETRHTGGLLVLGQNFRQVVGDRRFVGYAAAMAIGAGAMFSYIAASPFVVQKIFGFTPTQFSLVFAFNALSLVTAMTINSRLVSRISVRRLLIFGVGVVWVSGLGLLAVSLFSPTTPWPLLALLLTMMFGMGLTMGNAVALAQDQVPSVAGTGSAVIGAAQFAVAAIVSPLVGLGGESTSVPMAVSIAVCGTIALTALLTLTRDRPETRLPGFRFQKNAL
ncbi:multidrug resistance transporter, MFS superfamily (plasmid) [Rhodococcus jostii RHA1]|uniref:Multidrug resistance transporter, MFS superfamily n=1 Tax=Rhodococcus jostii (strain RHA1) TaxID=101510 RepID=Q0RV66_RHOJR|nr:multidrug effflux MFS transporter [Rhodococcus jostii]ABH00820.1 multidrug resistance transporter, MFS superfamily [Rhodococcus jostii RHA1]